MEKKVIKFRAWQDDAMICQEQDGVYGTKQFLHRCYEDCELMQFTGLLDKNGNEIYEGDILEWFDDSLNRVICRAPILWHQPSTGFRFDPTLIDKASKMHTSASKATVIGNIHEHPELLKPFPTLPSCVLSLSRNGILLSCS